VFDRAAFAAALQGQDAAIYGVGLPEQFTFDDSIFQSTNVDILGTFLEALRESPVRRLVYLSTYEVFEVVDKHIRESHPVADTGTMSAYFAAMTRAYVLATTRAESMGTTLTTIHPAAVYGGRNTGDGVTNVIENLLRWRVWRLPTILPGRFPVVHAESLARAIVASLDHPGAFIVSDGMSSLGELARAVRAQARSWVPPTIPKAMAYAATALIEGLARLMRVRPILAKVQLDFITNGAEPLAERAQQQLGWMPMPLAEGLRRYLAQRRSG
jgi:nucleoside-diphosphate-sugar epimerase